VTKVTAKQNNCGTVAEKYKINAKDEQADRLMLFSPFSAACNWATFPPYLFGFSSCCLA